MAEGTRALDGFVLLSRIFPLHVLLLRPMFRWLDTFRCSNSQLGQ